MTTKPGKYLPEPLPNCWGMVRQFYPLDATSLNLMRAAMQPLQLSARAFHRVLKLARTLADLAGMDQIQPAHLAGTLQYRLRVELG